MNTTEKKLTAADIALYIGCDVDWNGVVYRLSGLRQSNPIEIGIERKGVQIWVEIEAVKPILRHLSDTTIDLLREKSVIYKAACSELGTLTHGSAADTLYLLRNQFDLFGWIEAGLAIRKTENSDRL